jgi:hypothetical protein
MRPDIALRRFSEVISPSGMFAILDGDAPIDAPWVEEEQAIMIDLVTKIDGKRPNWWMSAKQRITLPLVEHPQFSRVGSKVTAPMKFNQSIADYLRCLHSRATFSEQHLGEELSREFDAAITDLLSRYAVNRMVTFDVQTRLEWGRPLPD